MTNIIVNSNINQNFESISDFIWCMKAHGEVEFEYQGKAYSITHANGFIDIGEGYYIRDGIAYNVKSNDKCIDMVGKQYKTADEALEYTIDGIRLREIITEVKVIVRTV